MVAKTRNKILKKLKEKEDQLFDVLNDIQDMMDESDDEELSSMGVQFTELVIDFIHENDTISLNDLREFIENSDEDEE